ncbi:uncharacterized protein LOC108713975 isoform X3 [Xenopus laevis]|uniref:Uncharacterized protein LOC108713975 isoform X3 n=1 Tax=Xenopus laevis TaxID=8355 RepID=A0A8J1MX39_XENLA|nr:uncharacterized protein LOC108713975 isoform X3 [Xenopus laevis]XP_041446031.1 uncharacterized protein LOC108713975 isoform X3 [Xenopus laevis]
MALPLYLILGNILYIVVSGSTTIPTLYTSDYISTSPRHHVHVITDTYTTELGETTLKLHSHVKSASATHLDQKVTASITDSMKLKNEVTSTTGSLASSTPIQRVTASFTDKLTSSLELKNDVTSTTASPRHHGHKSDETTLILHSHDTSAFATAEQNGQAILQGVTSASVELSKPTIKCQRVNSSWVEIICFSVIVNPPIKYNVFWNSKIYDTKTQQGAMPEKILIPLTSGSKVELSCEAQKGSVTKYSDPLLICEDEASNKEPEKPPEEHGTRHLINISRLITSWGRKTETYIILAVCVPIIIFTLLQREAC